MLRRNGMHRRSSPAVLGVTLLAALTAILAAPAAQAGPLGNSAAGCERGVLERPFLPWQDLAEYHLVPGGTFEAGAPDWELSGAGVVSGNESYYIHGAGETSSLAISPRGSATSPTMCVGLFERTLRLFVRSSAASLGSTLKVEVLLEDALGNTSAAPIGVVPAVSSTDWNPHIPMEIAANLLPLVGDTAPARFRLTAQGSAGWRIDDVYLDPRYH